MSIAGVQQLASGELHLDDALARATRPELVQQSPYWVKNETGATVTIWLASGLQAAPASAPGANLVALLMVESTKWIHMLLQLVPWSF